MTAKSVTLPANEDGDVAVWKALVGGRYSHALARPVFPRHQPNYSFDKGVLIRIRIMYRVSGALPLGDGGGP